jgi:XTP/dITP diphosphohydrolase
MPESRAPGHPVREKIVLYAATGNRGKLEEFVRAAGEELDVLPLPGFHLLPPCPEKGSTFEENARQKAQYYSRGAPGLVFADDSGLEVKVLGGAPGVYSARYAGPGASDEANNDRLLAALAGVPAGVRAARFVCVIALARGGEILSTFEGAAEGVILDAPRGAGGFGYDPLFLFPALGATFAEITAEQKWSHSHRGMAFRKMKEFLISLA